MNKSICVFIVVACLFAAITSAQKYEFTFFPGATPLNCDRSSDSKVTVEVGICIDVIGLNLDGNVDGLKVTNGTATTYTYTTYSDKDCQNSLAVVGPLTVDTCYGFPAPLDHIVRVSNTAAMLSGSFLVILVACVVSMIF